MQQKKLNEAQEKEKKDKIERMKQGPAENMTIAVLKQLLKEVRHRSCILKKLAKLCKIVISNPFQSSPSSAILVPFLLYNHPFGFFLR